MNSAAQQPDPASSQQQECPPGTPAAPQHAAFRPSPLATMRSRSGSPGSLRSPPPATPTPSQQERIAQEQQDRLYVQKFWTTYDDILMLSLFTQLGILCRIAAAYLLRVFDGVFSNDSALFANLPLNCLSCFVLGALSSGESAMAIISTRFTPPGLQQQLSHHDHFEELESELAEEYDLGRSSNIGRRIRRRRQKKSKRRNRSRRRWRSAEGDLQGDLREVQLLALERRIRSSPCLVLFPVKKEDIDVVENYFGDGYQGSNASDDHSLDRSGLDSRQNSFEEDLNDEEGIDDLALHEEIVAPSNNKARLRSDLERHPEQVQIQPAMKTTERVEPTFSSESDELSAVSLELNDEPAAQNQEGPRQPQEQEQVQSSSEVDYGTVQGPDLDQFISNITTEVSQNISRFGRVSLADGWDVGTSPQETSADLMLGLRDGLCGALSSFSSWISAMVGLLSDGKVITAVVGLSVGIQLPIVAYRAGQHVAVYIFVWRARRETRRDERRGYGIRVRMDDDDEAVSAGSIDGRSMESGMSSPNLEGVKSQEDAEKPSVRAIITALFMFGLVAQITSLSFYSETQDRLVALSMLFSPLGVLTRWQLAKLNPWRPSFPIGTFICNIGACALSGSLGSLLAGNPGPRERIVLVSIIAGFGGTLSSVARFIVEILRGMDPILFRLDGVYYAASSVFWGMVISFVFTASVDWADAAGK